MIREKLMAGLVGLLKSKAGLEVLDFMKVNVTIKVRGFTVFSEDIRKDHVNQLLNEMGDTDDIPPGPDTVLRPESGVH